MKNFYLLNTVICLRTIIKMQLVDSSIVLYIICFDYNYTYNSYVYIIYAYVYVYIRYIYSIVLIFIITIIAAIQS